MGKGEENFGRESSGGVKQIFCQSKQQVIFLNVWLLFISLKFLENMKSDDYEVLVLDGLATLSSLSLSNLFLTENICILSFTHTHIKYQKQVRGKAN